MIKGEINEKMCCLFQCDWDYKNSCREIVKSDKR